MKRILSFIISALIIITLPFYTSASGMSVVLNASTTTVKAGDTFTVTVNVSGAKNAMSASVAVTLSENIEFVSKSGEWLVSNAMLTTFDEEKLKGAIAYSADTNLNGNIFKFTLKAKNASKIEQSIKVSVEYKSGVTVIGTDTDSVNVITICKTHSYGEYTSINNNQHQHICSVCNYVEKGNHTWNDGVITKQANCKEEGNRKFTCTACGAEKNETIAKTSNHTWSSYTITKHPTCTSSGTQTRTCSICGKAESQSVAATGHSFGTWTISKEPTCTANGTQTRKCSKCGATETKNIPALGHNFSNPTITKEPTCTESGVESGKCTRCGQETSNIIKPTGHKFGDWKEVKKATCTEGGAQKRICSKCKTEETRNTDPLGHDFDNPTVVKEATISSTGLIEGKCKRCGETTKEIIPCTAIDNITGIRFETKEGVFSEGTVIKTEEIKSDNANYSSVKNLLSEITKEFYVYDISASLNGTEIQPNGEVKVTFNVPDGFGNDVALYAISDNGTSKKIEATVSEDGKTISATVTAFETYAVCNLGSKVSEENSEAIENTENNGVEKAESNYIWIFIFVIAFIVIAGTVVAIILVKKKKTHNSNDSGMFM